MHTRTHRMTLQVVMGPAAKQGDMRVARVLLDERFVLATPARTHARTHAHTHLLASRIEAAWGLAKTVVVPSGIGRGTCSSQRLTYSCCRCHRYTRPHACTHMRSHAPSGQPPPMYVGLLVFVPPQLLLRCDARSIHRRCPPARLLGLRCRHSINIGGTLATDYRGATRSLKAFGSDPTKRCFFYPPLRLFFWAAPWCSAQTSTAATSSARRRSCWPSRSRTRYRPIYLSPI